MIEGRCWVPTSVLSHLAYEYDQVGNRKRKLDSAQLLDVIYTYDTDIPLGQPSPYDSRNNRLMSYQTFDAAALDSTTYYYYNDCGNVTRVVTDEEATDNYTSTWLEYARNGRAVIYAVGESWEWQGPGFDPANYDISYAREFRYDGAVSWTRLGYRRTRRTIRRSVRYGPTTLGTRSTGISPRLVRRSRTFARFSLVSRG